MKTNKFSLNVFQIFFSVMLVTVLVLGGFSAARATTIAGTVIAWGRDYQDAITVPPGLTDIVAISSYAYHNLALKSDGTVVGWGNNVFGQLDIPAGLTDVIAISAGGLHCLALKSDGTVVGWGDNRYGETTIPSGLTGVIAISAGNYHNLALKADGTVVGWGENTLGQATIPEGLSGITAVSAGGMHSLALKSDGTVIVWGSNGFGQLNVPPGLTGVIAISAGFIHNLALKSDGTVVAWGNNSYGQGSTPADLTGVVSIVAGGYHNLALKEDGTAVAWGYDVYEEATIPSNLTGVIAFAAGEHHSVALVPASVPANTAPTANPGGPYLGAVNTSIAFDGSLSSDPEADPLTYAWDFGDTSTASSSMPNHTYTGSGLYNVCLTVNDGTLNSEPACTMAVVYDPSDGFVTGGGWITSPAGAYKPDESLSGHATFGFVAKYQKGATIPSGNTAFGFDLADMAFASQSYEWLVVNQGGTNAQFKGSGTINAAFDPNGNPYKFMIWAGDGRVANDPDTFRIRIWWEDTAGAQIDIYDNGVNQEIGAGNIVVHTGK